MRHKRDESDVQPRALRVREATRAYRIGKTRLYALMKEGRLATVKVGGTRLIPIDSLEALIAIQQPQQQDGARA